MTAALEGVEWSAARPGRTLPPGKTRYPLYMRLGGLQGRSGRAENLVPTGIGSRTVQPVAQSLYRLSYPAHFTRLSSSTNLVYECLLNKNRLHKQHLTYNNNTFLMFLPFITPLLWQTRFELHCLGLWSRNKSSPVSVVCVWIPVNFVYFVLIL